MRGRHYYEFGSFRLDPVRGLLTSGNEVIPVTPKVLHTLLVLVENRNRVVGKEELIRAVWPDTFVEEGNLTQNISTLRKTLGERPTEHNYIATIPKQGYRFVADVTETRLGQRVSLGRPLLWAGALAAVLATVAGVLWFSGRQPNRAKTSLTVAPLTAYPGLELHPSFSPDGNQVAFAWHGEKQDNLDIYVKLIGSEEPLRLTSYEARDFRPAWSPDGRSIAFLREQSKGSAAVIVVPAIGGPEVELTVVHPGHLGSYLMDPYLEWSHDGRRLLTIDRDAADKPAAIVAISVKSGEKRRLTTAPDSYLGDLTGAISPDGRTLAFSRRVSGNLGALCLQAL